MRIRKLGNRIFVNLNIIKLEILRSHINYSWWWGGEKYHLSIPFNPFRIKKYGFYISFDGTPSNARYYRPKREWGLVEPNDPAYREALRKKRESKNE